MAERGRRRGRRERALLWCVLVAAWEAAWGQLRYSVPEEVPKGSFVGDVGKDLGLELPALRHRGVRVLDTGRTQYFFLDLQNGHLSTKKRVDREEICAAVSKCALNFEILVRNPMKLYRGEVEILDINDNSPTFPVRNSVLEISEYTALGTRFPLEKAEDPDIGMNSLQNYECSESSYFSLDVKNGDDGVMYPELILVKSLDREQQATHNLILTATDRGSPVKSGSTTIQIIVLDGNDNAPEFTQPVYRVTVREDLVVGSRVLQVTATDKDEGPNAEVKYTFFKIPEKFEKTFELDPENGEIRITEKLNFEEQEFYELDIQARDAGGLSSHGKVLIKVSDVNNHVPEIVIMSVFSPVPEDTPLGTVIAIFNVQDRDSGENGEVRCSVDGGVPFRLERSFDNYYGVVTARELDREEVSEYNVTVRAADGGSPALWSSAVLALRVLDVNDNAPVFAEARYSARLPENNAAGALVLTVRATDADWGQNARVRYRLSEGRVRGAPLSSYVSVQAETGALYALRPFDYEEVREVGLWVRAEDGGAPPLSSNVSVRLVIVDENDNAPQVLYPPAAAAPGAGWAGVELAPRSAEPGALVAKVVAVDADAGQNAWLSYELAKATEPGLFRVGLHSGEVRTARFPLARDAARQSLVVVVKDHGRPALSATATLTVVLAESVAELLSELGSAAAAAEAAGEPAGSLTRWLVVAVAAVSCLFLAFLLLLLALRLRRWRRSQLLAAGSGALRGVPASHFVGIDGVRAFLHSYSHEVSLTADSRKSQLRLSGGSCCDTLPARPLAESSGVLVPAEDHIAENNGQNSFQRSPFKVGKLCAGSGSPNYRRRSGSTVGSSPAPPTAQCSYARSRAKSRNCPTQPVLQSATGISYIYFSPVLEKPYLRRSAEHASAKQRMEVRPAARGRAAAGRVALLAVLLLVCCRAAAERIRYAIPEELGRGSLVGPLARDLGLSPADLPARRLRIVSGDEKQYFYLGEDNTNLRVKERIDREGICGAVSPCVLSLEAVVEKPFNLFHVSVTIEDINDNSPRFDRDFVAIEMIESTPPGARFPLGSGRDPDVGVNSLQNYQLTPQPLFSLVVRESPDGTKHVELVLEKSLDREKQTQHYLTLTAVDGGDPVRSGTTQIKINVTDANDNPPVFTKEVYKVRLLENLPEGSLAFQVKATDDDEGTNAEIIYSFSDIANSARQLFTLDSETGDVKVTGPLDYEEGKYYEAIVEGKDGGGLSTHAKVHIDIVDENDNAPTLSLLPIVNPIPEDSVPSTAVAVINVRDRDSGNNGKVSCNIDGDFPFRLEPSSENTYKLTISSALDRENISAYNITITARDWGSPALSSRAALVLEVSDVNDNAPVFEEAAYSAYVAENNAAGAPVVRVRARDADAGANGRVSYWLAGGSAGASPYVSVEAETGALFAQRSFDYEQCREFAVAVRAQDGGSPARSSTATVRVFVLDRNDNAPRVLWPAAGAGAGAGAGAAPFEVVPRSAEAGYLVAKVVAVDADAGRNAWLSYELVQAPEPALFRVGLHSGEVRTARAVSERDAAKQRLVAVVKDHGQPALSATATLHVVLAESLQEALPELSERAAGADSPAELQFYLVLALALLSALFLLSVALAAVARVRRAGPPAVLRCLGAQRFSVAGAAAFPADFCEGTLPYSYNLCVAPGRAAAEGPWLPPPPPLPSLPAEELLGGEPCGKRSPSSSAGAGEPPADPGATQVCKPALSRCSP
ncbi:uncharacterized protein LOC104040880 [Phalacrocorax carbo]|uniref:uncharacterized protein LOC104040880 n=1 Tax=Phalacrocorax carbo TaxID=9209 RepID=UPI00311A0CCE